MHVCYSKKYIHKKRNDTHDNKQSFTTGFIENFVEFNFLYESTELMFHFNNFYNRFEQIADFVI